MTTWRYHVTREVIDGEDRFAIREVYFDDDGKVVSWTENPIAARGDTWTECVDDLSLMTRAMNAPVLDLSLDPPAFVQPTSFAGSFRSHREHTPEGGRR